MVRYIYTSLATILMLGLTAQAQFLENFDDGGASARWSAPVVEAENGAFDGTVDFAFDYSTLGIPAAPGGGNSIGLMMEANRTDNANANGDQGEAVGMTSLLATMPASDYVLSMDVYFNVDDNAGGTTEMGIFGAHASGANFPADQGLNDDVPFDFGVSNGDGVAWFATGDGGASNDLHRFDDAGNADAGSQSGLGSFDSLADGTIPGVPTGTNNFPSFGPQELWVNVSIESVGGNLSWKMNGATLDSISGAPYSGGTILLGYADYFNSVADPSLGNDSLLNHTHFIIFDNVRLDAVPEPSGLGLLAVGMIGIVFRRRR